MVIRAIMASRTVLTIAITVLASLASAQAQTPQFVPKDESPEDYPAGNGRDDTFYACTACHGFRLIAQQGMNRRQWAESIDLMVSRHGMPPLPDNDRKIVLDYLEATYPPSTPSSNRGWQNPFSPR